MENNVIYLSDASFDHLTKEAGIGVKNLYTDQSFSLVVHAMNIREAEEFALLEAISHAVLNNHRNCVFIYDHIAINTAALGAFFNDMFDRIQFLWMKRDYLTQVDILASNVRCRHTQNDSPVGMILKRASLISDKELITTLMPLTRGETYGYLCAISGTAPMMREYPSTLRDVNEKIVALLQYAGSTKLQKQLKERFKTIRGYKHTHYNELLETAIFDESWFEYAAHECHIETKIA